MAQQLDRETRRRRALAGEDLVRRYRAGLLKDHGHVADLLALTCLLAGDNPLFAAARPTHSNERRTPVPGGNGEDSQGLRGNCFAATQVQAAARKCFTTASRWAALRELIDYLHLTSVPFPNRLNSYCIEFFLEKETTVSRILSESIS